MKGHRNVEADGENLKNLVSDGLKSFQESTFHVLSSHGNAFQLLTKWQEETNNPLRAQVKKEIQIRKGAHSLVVSLHSVGEEQKFP